MAAYTRISRLAGIFTGAGFADKQGRRPTIEDLDFHVGPLDIICDQANGTILSIVKSSQERLPDEVIIDGEGMVATYGFVDSHTHALFGGQRGHEHFLRWQGATYLEITQAGGGIHNTVLATAHLSDQELLDLLRRRLQVMLQCGTTTVEVKSGYSKNAQDELRLLRLLKKIQNEQGIPEILPTFLGLHALPPGTDEKTFCDSMIEVLPIVSKEGLACFVDAFPEQGFFSLDESIRFTQEAKKLGIPSKIHADEITDIGACMAFAEQGALSVDHVLMVNDDAIAFLANTATVATLMPATSFYLGLPYANARKLIDAGVRVALATDFNPGTAPAIGFPFTVLLSASQLKMTPSEILCGCTFNGALGLGLEKTHGILQSGMKANILLWSCKDVLSGHKFLEVLENIFANMNRPSVIVCLGKAICQ